MIYILWGASPIVEWSESAVDPRGGVAGVVRNGSLQLGREKPGNGVHPELEPLSLEFLKKA